MDSCFYQMGPCWPAIFWFIVAPYCLWIAFRVVYSFYYRLRWWGRLIDELLIRSNYLEWHIEVIKQRLLMMEDK